METNASSSLETATTKTEIPVTQPNTAIPSTQVPSGQASGQPPANATPQEITDWQKDERFERMWKKDPNQLYKSYRNIEKVYDPLKKETETLKGQIGQIDSILKEYGYELKPEQLKSVLEELKTYTTDDEKILNPTVKIGKYFQQQPWWDDPAYVEKLDKFNQNLYWEFMQERYPGMTLPQIQKMNELEAKNREIESKLTQREKDEEQKEFKIGIGKGLEKIKSYCQEIGFAYTKEIEDKMFDYGAKTGVSPDYLFGAFIELYGKETQKAFAEKIKQEQLQSLEKNKDKVILPTGSESADTTIKPGTSIADRLRRIIK